MARHDEKTSAGRAKTLSRDDTGDRLAEVDEVPGCLVMQTVEHHSLAILSRFQIRYEWRQLSEGPCRKIRQWKKIGRRTGKKKNWRWTRLTSNNQSINWLICVAAQTLDWNYNAVQIILLKTDNDGIIFCSLPTLLELGTRQWQHCPFILRINSAYKADIDFSQSRGYTASSPDRYQMLVGIALYDCLVTEAFLDVKKKLAVDCYA